FPGCTLNFSNDFELLHEQINAAFPLEKDNFARLHQFLISFKELDLNQKVESAREALGRFLKTPMLIDMLFCPLMFYGSAKPDDMDLNQFVIMYKSIFMEGFGRPFKGVRPIMKTLVRQYKKLGGELRLRAGVKQIITDSGRAIGVILDDGTQLTANRILSSAGSVETDQLIPAESPQSDINSASTQVAGDVTFNEIIDTLDVTPAELGHD
ncbi:MAG: phytoene dehydrogenase, partial [Planctomycetaceae bacterium]|nr:phytoene dehydrogenase [Planctomycetaceae bacterium]